MRNGKILDVCSNVYSGGTPNKKHDEYYVGGNIPWLNTSEIKFNRITATEKFITDEGYSASSAKWVPANAVIVAMYGATAARVAISKIPLTTNQACCNLIIDDSKADYRYVYYWLCSRYTELASLANGGAQQNLNAGQIKDFPIALPHIDAQKKIADLLSAFDDKIEVNNEINENLLQQAGAIFNKFYDESSNQQPFTSLINVLGGGTPKTGNPNFWNGPIPFFTPKDAGTPYTFQTEKYITESGLTHCNSRLYQKDTTFVTARGTVGKVSLAGTPMAMNQSCYALASETVDPLLVYFYVLKAVASLKHKASGAVFDAIVTRDFDGETINVLSDDEAKSVLAIIKPMMESIHNNSEENIRLAALRDSLLPRLMSGELDVSALDI